MIIYKIGDSMKLNNKGFAFSTMLYGSIALIAAVLYIILNINKTSVDTTYYYGEEVLQDLNDCVTEEIALENCYSSHNNPSDCNSTAYRACLGVTDSNAPEQGVIAAETLKGVNNSNVLTLKSENNDSGLYKDPYVLYENRYIYMGSEVNNYISYSGKLWRIVSIENDGSLLLIDPVKYTSEKWDSGKGSEWGSSSLYNLLNINYLSSIVDPTKLIQRSWPEALIYPSLFQGTDYNINDLLNQEKTQNTVPGNVGLLYLSDYLKASFNTKCQTEVFNPGTKDCNSWLSQYKGWVIDINAEETVDSEGHVYHFGDGTVTIPPSTTPVSQQNKAFAVISDEIYDVYPVILLDRNSIIKEGGNGTQANPYVLK